MVFFSIQCMLDMTSFSFTPVPVSIITADIYTLIIFCSHAWQWQMTQQKGCAFPVSRWAWLSVLSPYRSVLVLAQVIGKLRHHIHNLYNWSCQFEKEAKFMIEMMYLGGVFINWTSIIYSIQWRNCHMSLRLQRRHSLNTSYWSIRSIQWYRRL
jgi:hypothetical protein